MSHSIELACDTGEAATDAGRAQEFALLGHVTAVSVACGGHAGDEASMLATVRAAREAGCTIGAHPSYPDRANFGRAAMDIPNEALLGSVRDQLSALAAVCVECGASIRFVKPHGALYHAVSSDPALARAFAETVLGEIPGASLVALIGAPALEVWRSMDVPAIAEGFADRAYEPDGTLRSRREPGALITDPEDAAAQAVRLASLCDLLCVHGDSPRAVAIAAAVRAGLRDAGYAIGGSLGS